ncbi:MAG: hypothetical protein V1817_05100 [Candidatus Micrarchaeota archaeon]
MKYLDDILRKSPIGVWQSMPEAEALDWTGKPHNRGIGRIDSSALWRVSTRKELVEYYKHIMNGVYKNFALSIVFLVCTLVAFTLYTQSKDLTVALGAVVLAALCSRFYTQAWGGYSGGWSDYEHDPVQMVPHSSYLLNKGWGLM